MGQKGDSRFSTISDPIWAEPVIYPISTRNIYGFLRIDKLRSSVARKKTVIFQSIYSEKYSSNFLSPSMTNSLIIYNSTAGLRVVRLQSSFTVYTQSIVKSSSSIILISRELYLFGLTLYFNWTKCQSIWVCLISLIRKWIVICLSNLITMADRRLNDTTIIITTLNISFIFKGSK